MPVERCACGHGWCYRCAEPWCRVKAHPTDYGPGGCFPLCEGCWSALTPTERLPYYYMLIGSWLHDGTLEAEIPRAAIEQAVLAGG